MFALLLIIHLVVAAVLILVIMLQSGKAGDLASTFGGATSQTAFGSRGAATILTKATAICGVTFMLTSLGLAILYTQERGTTIMDRAAPPAAPGETVPADPAPVPAPPTEDADPGGGSR